MPKLNLTAKNETERRILAHLEANASEALAEKIHASGKTLGAAVSYCTEQARKLGSGCVCVPDDQVFGWVVHFFEDVTVTGGKPITPAKSEKMNKGGAQRRHSTGSGQGGDAEEQESGAETEAAAEPDTDDQGENPFASLSIFGGEQ